MGLVAPVNAFLGGDGDGFSLPGRYERLHLILLIKSWDAKTNTQRWTVT